MDYKNELNSDDDFDCSNSYGDNFTNNNSNSGYNGNGQNNSNGGLSKAELRKTNKPIMEKRRRARINHCLNELKSLILEAMKKDPARHTKLEKADILEMTVKHLQSVQRQQLNMAIQTDPSVIHKFKTGFVECADEVNRYINQLDGVEATVRQRLTNHLNNCATGLEQIGSMTNFNNGYRGQLGANTTAPGLFTNALGNPLATAATATTAPIFPPLPQDLNNNSNPAAAAPAPIQMGGLQLIPSRLPSGEFALIMPNGNHATSLLNNNNNSPFATWPHNNNTSSTNVLTKSTTITHPGNQPQINDFATNFQRMSAFSKPQILQNQKLNTIIIAPNHKGNINNNNNNNQHQFTTTPTTAFHQPQNNLHQNSTTTTVSPPLSPISTVSSHGDDSSIMHTSSDFITSRPSTPPQDVPISQHNFSGVFSTPSTPSSAESSLSLSTHLQQQQVSSTSGGDLNASLKRPRSSEAADSSDSLDELSAKKFQAALQKSAEQEEEEGMWRPW